MNGRRVSRRQFLRGAGALGVTAYFAPDLLRAYERAWAVTQGGVLRPAGTTLERTIIPTGSGPYFRFIEGPGWPFVVRNDMGVTPKKNRENRRVGLASVVHLTDIHLIDAQSPARVEFLDRYSDPPGDPIPFQSAFRAQETLTAQVSEAMIRRVNSLGGGPVTGRLFDVTVSTGDSVPAGQRARLDDHAVRRRRAPPGTPRTATTTA